MLAKQKSSVYVSSPATLSFSQKFQNFVTIKFEIFDRFLFKNAAVFHNEASLFHSSINITLNEAFT